MANFAPTDLGPQDYLDLILARRLANITSPQYSASLSFDVASGMDDDLAEVAAQNGLPSTTRRNAVGDFVRGYLANQPTKLPVRDLADYQRRLKGYGYLPPDHPAGGDIDDTFMNAAYNHAADAGERFREGHGHPGAISTQSAIELLNSTLPSKILGGLVAEVKGLGGLVKRASQDFWYDLIGQGASGEAAKQHKSPLDRSVQLSPRTAAFEKSKSAHLGDDAIATLSLLGLLGGVNDLILAGKATAGLAGAEFGAEAAARFGVREGVSAFARPAEEVLAAQRLGMTSRIARSVMQRIPGIPEDAFAEFVKQYGLNAQAQRPILKVLGQSYSGLSKAAFIPNAYAILNPESETARRVQEAPNLPPWVDLATLVIHPQSGLMPKTSAIRAAESAGLNENILKAMRRPELPLDPYRQLGLPIPTAAERERIHLQAFLETDALERLHSSPKWPSIVRKGPSYMRVANDEAIIRARERAILNSAGPAGERAIDPDVWQRAQEWGYKNDKQVMAFLNKIHTSAAERERLGIKGFNPHDDFIEAEKITTDLTDQVAGAYGPHTALSAEDEMLRVEYERLKSSWKRGNAPVADGLRMQQLETEIAGKQSVLQEETLNALLSDPTVKARIEKGRFRVVPMRHDNPYTKQSIGQLASDWQTALASNDQAQIDLARGKLRILGLGEVEERQVAKQLAVALDHAPHEITDLLPSDVQSELRSRGYKAAMVGHNVILQSDLIEPGASDVAFSGGAYILASLGLSGRKVDPRTITKLALQSWGDAAEEIFLGAERGFQDGIGKGFVNAIFDNLRSSREALSELGQGEGKFQRALTRYKSGFLSVNDVTIPRIKDVLRREYGMIDDDVQRLAPDLMKAAKVAFATGKAQTPAHMLSILDKLGGAMRLHGWQGFSELARAATISDLGVPRALTGKLGLPELKLGKAVQHIPGLKALPETFGFLPNHLQRAALALRFTLNPAFEARLLTKGQLIKLAAEDLSPSFRPRTTMVRKGILDEARDIWTRVEGGSVTALDDAERVVLQGGLFGYNARDHATYDYWRVYKQKVGEYTAAGQTAEAADAAAIGYLKEKGRRLWTYGGRSPLEKSVNFLFFPFSFEKKVVTLAADYMTAKPVRILLLHAAAKHIETIEKSDGATRSKISEVIAKYAPMYRELNKLNAFAHGLSPGEFGGVMRPVADALGVGIEAAAGALLPFAGTEGDEKTFSQLLQRVAPGTKSIADLVNDVRAQAGVFSPQPGQQTTNVGPLKLAETGREQVDDYFTHLNGLQEEYAQLGVMFGAGGSFQSFLQSRKVPDFLKAEYQSYAVGLAQRFPAGYDYESRAAQSAVSKKVALETLLRKTHKTRAEQGVVALAAQELSIAQIPAGKTPAGKIAVQITQLQEMRDLGLRLHAKLGDPFENLWRTLGYERKYGPLTEVQVA